jgi:hypothetical protein
VRTLAALALSVAAVVWATWSTSENNQNHADATRTVAPPKSYESFVRTIPDARKLQLNDMVTQFMPPLTACLQENDPKVAPINQGLRELAIKARQEHGLDLDDHLPQCTTLGSASDPNNIIVRSTGYVPSVEIPDSLRIRLCFYVHNKIDLHTGPVDYKAEMEAFPLYCALVPSTVSAKVFGD